MPDSKSPLIKILSGHWFCADAIDTTKREVTHSHNKFFIIVLIKKVNALVTKHIIN